MHNAVCVTFFFMGIARTILSFVLFAVAWLFFGVRVVLDVIGWSTAPDDLPVAAQRAMILLSWIAELPAAIPYGAAVLLTMWLMYTAWPRSPIVLPHGAKVLDGLFTLPAPSQPPKLSSIYIDGSSLRTELQRSVGSLKGHPRSFRPLTLPTETCSRTRSFFAVLNEFEIATPAIPKDMTSLDGQMVVSYLDLLLPFIGRSQKQEACKEAQEFIDETAKAKI